MRRIKYYQHDKRYKGMFRPVYGEAPVWIWAGFYVFSYMQNKMLSVFLWFNDRIEHGKMPV
jgi:hypothetical protein